MRSEHTEIFQTNFPETEDEWFQVGFGGSSNITDCKRRAWQVIVRLDSLIDTSKRPRTEAEEFAEYDRACELGNDPRALDVLMKREDLENNQRALDVRELLFVGHEYDLTRQRLVRLLKVASGECEDLKKPPELLERVSVGEWKSCDDKQIKVWKSCESGPPKDEQIEVGRAKWTRREVWKRVSRAGKTPENQVPQRDVEQIEDRKLDASPAEILREVHKLHETMEFLAMQIAALDVKIAVRPFERAARIRRENCEGLAQGRETRNRGYEERKIELLKRINKLEERAKENGTKQKRSQFIDTVRKELKKDWKLEDEQVQKKKQIYKWLSKSAKKSL
jgi:hypothetical protein